jgi:hypothetical protein
MSGVEPLWLVIMLGSLAGASSVSTIISEILGSNPHPGACHAICTAVWRAYRVRNPETKPPEEIEMKERGVEENVVPVRSWYDV